MKERGRIARLIRRAISELAWKADSLCHSVIEWAEDYDPDELLRQIRDEVQAFGAKENGKGK